MSENWWERYILDDYSFTAFERGERVLDVGCGDGGQLRVLRARRCVAVGIDVDRVVLDRCRRDGLRVLIGAAEALPLRSGSLDGVICKVVLPYTNESHALTEISRVLAPGGIARLCSHGAGYYLRYLLAPPHSKLRLYALRTIVNTWVYRLFGRRLPGFLGDTVYQSRRRLKRQFRRARLRVLAEPSSGTFCGLPVFIYQTVEKCR